MLVIGLGRFGAATAGQLDRQNREVLVVDVDPERVQKWANRVSHAAQADAKSMDALKQLGAGDFQIAVVATGASVESSVLIASNLVDLGVPQIWAKAISTAHGKILRRIGVHHVIHPEREAGERVAHVLSGAMLDFIQFDNDYVIAKMHPPHSIRGLSLEASEVRSRHRVTVVGVKTPGEPFTHATPDTVISARDLIIVSGTTSAVEHFAAIG